MTTSNTVKDGEWKTVELAHPEAVTNLCAYGGEAADWFKSMEDHVLHILQYHQGLEPGRYHMKLRARTEGIAMGKESKDWTDFTAVRVS